MFNETNLKDSTGIRVASCPRAAKSYGMETFSMINTEDVDMLCILQHTTHVSKIWILKDMMHVHIGESKLDLTWMYGSGAASPSLGSFKSNTRMLTKSSNPCRMTEWDWVFWRACRIQTCRSIAPAGWESRKQQQHPTHWHVQWADKDVFNRDWQLHWQRLSESDNTK